GSDGARSEPARLESPDFEEVGAWPVAALLEEMATGGAAPACGSAAAVAAGLSAALAGKVARRSRDRLGDADDLIRRTDELRRRATELAGADGSALLPGHRSPPVRPGPYRRRSVTWQQS